MCMYVYFLKGLEMIITFCGHSSYFKTEEDKKEILKSLKEISGDSDITFLLGGYGSFDSFARDCAYLYKTNHPNSKVVFVSPYLGKWLDERKDALKELYDEIVYPEIEAVPPKFAILKRNQWMVNQADYVIAYVNLHYGGAYQTLLYAHKHFKPYKNIYQGKYELY